MSHPLDGATARVRRAVSHINEFRAGLEQLRRACREHFSTEYDPETLQITARHFEPVIPPDASVIVGETVYNLRASLDYIVYELAREDSGSYQDGTQFPIEDVEFGCSPNRKRKWGFKTRIPTYLRGLSVPHIESIRNLQPYKGVAWTKTLRDISNPDKHRRLTGVVDASQITVTISGGESGAFEGRPGLIYPGKGEGGADVHLHGEHTFDIAFPDGALVLETLQTLQIQVTATIDAFKPEFKV